MAQELELYINEYGILVTNHEGIAKALAHMGRVATKAQQMVESFDDYHANPTFMNQQTLGRRREDLQTELDQSPKHAFDGVLYAPAVKKKSAPAADAEEAPPPTPTEADNAAVLRYITEQIAAIHGRVNQVEFGIAQAESNTTTSHADLERRIDSVTALAGEENRRLDDRISRTVTALSEHAEDIQSLSTREARIMDLYRGQREAVRNLRNIVNDQRSQLTTLRGEQDDLVAQVKATVPGIAVGELKAGHGALTERVGYQDLSIAMTVMETDLKRRIDGVYDASINLAERTDAAIRHGKDSRRLINQRIATLEAKQAEMDQPVMVQPDGTEYAPVLRPCLRQDVQAISRALDDVAKSTDQRLRNLEPARGVDQTEGM